MHLGLCVCLYSLMWMRLPLQDRVNTLETGRPCEKGSVRVLGNAPGSSFPGVVTLLLSPVAISLDVFVC
jgi:hypothetical protein